MDFNNLFLNPICRNIPVKERESFLNMLNYNTKIFNKGEWIAQQGAAVTALYILNKGSVKTEMISESGTVLSIETIHAPNPLAAAFLFAENNTFPVDVVALESCEIIFITKESVVQLLACNEKFLQGFMTFNSNRAHFLSERLKFLSIKTIKGKLAQYILTRTHTIEFTLGMNQTALADYFGVARPSLSRSLSEMVHDGIITLKGKNGKILNLMKLKELIVQ
ncbi:MAG: Crp/Fnr family transcriptional regulator [Tannerella sp.]|jgi:CRP-like cAMP-binding protein|nr:Crp/Fnr family transcriptional regulator [Tannerella sp.]